MSEPPSEALLDYYIERVDSACADARAALHDARKAEQDFVATLREVMVMREEPRDPHAYVLARGAYDARGERVEPGTPARILPFPDDYPKNRLGLAEWLLRRDNPLTARVAVNRYWKLFFGKGLVETQENFGSQGTPPSHPELLDFLAAWFIDRGWDVKALCRLIVTSATYRQDSRPTPELVALDPDNRLLARGPRQRMEAERIRDAALAACGLLVDTIGGPSVKPYQPDGLWEDASKVGYQRDSGDALYRRSMYTFWKRTVHPPSMATFDAGNREVCVARREVTTTPLQALVLLNNPQFVEAARVLGAELTARHAEPAARLDAAFRRLLGRRPTDAQMTVLLAMYQEQVEHFASSADAHAYLGVGEWEQNEEADPAEAAATTAIIQAIMCLDEFQVNV